MTGAARVEDIAAWHVPVVAALNAESIANGWSVEAVAQLLAMPGAFGFIAHAPDAAGSVPAGFILCLPLGEATDVLALGVLPGKRRAGLGRVLLAAAADRARRGGAAKMMLEVAADNRPAIALYRAAGFRDVGRRAGYYRPAAGGPPGDALVFGLDL